MKVIMYTTHCPQCSVLSKKLEQKNIQYTKIDDIETMKKLGIVTVPVLSVNEKILNFKESINWINSLEV